MPTYVLRNGELVDKATAPPLHPVHGRGPMIIRDAMAPIHSMADGQQYDSRSAYYRSLKQQGCEIVGDDRAWVDQQPQFEPKPVGPDIKRAIEELESR